MNDTKPLGLLELADRVHLPAKWLKAEAGAGRIPHLRVGRHLLFNPEAVERALLERAANGTTAVTTEESEKRRAAT